MRAVREQPRLVLARILGAICLILVGMAIGSALDRGDSDRLDATRLRFVSAQRSLVDGNAQRRAGKERAVRADAVARRARTLARSNRRLRHELAAAKRARRKSRSQAHK